jgi:hypothetical protein
MSGVCTAGFCRCAATAECCAAQDETLCGDAGFKCGVPPESVGGDNTCRASHPRGLSRIRVYSDARDRWVRSRTIWNQHACAVTHVNEDGTVAKDVGLGEELGDAGAEQLPAERAGRGRWKAHGGSDRGSIGDVRVRRDEGDVERADLQPRGGCDRGRRDGGVLRWWGI